MNPYVPVRSTDVTLQRIGQEAILHDKRLGRTHVINASAARIWELCDGTSDQEQIAEAFAAHYQLPIPSVHDDVVTILATFRDLSLLD